MRECLRGRSNVKVPVGIGTVVTFEARGRPSEAAKVIVHGPRVAGGAAVPGVPLKATVAHAPGAPGPRIITPANSEAPISAQAGRASTLRRSEVLLSEGMADSDPGTATCSSQGTERPRRD